MDTDYTDNQWAEYKEHKENQAKAASGNTAIVIDDVGNELGIAPPDGFEIDLVYRDDGSLQVFAFNNTDRPRTLAEFAAGAWKSAVLVGGE